MRQILLGNNMGNRAVMLCLMQFQCFGVWILIGLPCIYITDHKHTQFRLVQNLQILYCFNQLINTEEQLHQKLDPEDPQHKQKSYGW